MSLGILAKAVFNKVVVRFSKSEPRSVFIVKYAYVLRDWSMQHRSRDFRDWLFYGPRTECPIKSSVLTVSLGSSV